MFWLCSYVASQRLAVVPQSGAKGKKFGTVYCITLNSNCEAEIVSKNLRKNGNRLNERPILMHEFI
jgi:hypothetical protein